MEEHQKEYIKLLDEKFGVKGKPRRAIYKRNRDVIDSGIVVELSNSVFNPRLVFLSDNERGYLHKWSMELDSEHLPSCVWLTRYNDPYLSIIDSFFI
mgnify:CR=1 FL=1